jgi:hypothetical protein
MNEAQQEMVKAPLRVALKSGRHFKDSSAVYEYLRDSGISPDLISAHQTEIFDCYLGVGAEAKGQLPLSPSTSVESRLNAPEIGLDGDDRSDQSDFAGPAFDSEVSPPANQKVLADNAQEILIISFFRPLRNDFKPLTAKICTGRVSYISDRVLRGHNLKKGRKSIILDWCYTGSNNNELSHTRCEVVKSEVLPGSEIALAEDHEKGDIEDTEEGTEEGENTELSKEPLNDMGESLSCWRKRF